jgi:hypothetical protein
MRPLHDRYRGPTDNPATSPSRYLKHVRRDLLLADERRSPHLLPAIAHD